MRKNEKRLGEESIGKLLLQFSLPAIIGMMVISMYSVVDRIFVGQVVGPLAITGISLTFPLAILMMAFGMLIGIGTGATISIKLGQQKKEEAEVALGNAFTLLLIIAFLTTTIGLFFLDPVLQILGANSGALVYAKQFIQIIMAFSVFQFIGFGLNGSMSASGNPKFGMMTMLMNAVINIVLLIVFIGFFGWGIRGSAFATAIAQGCSAIWVLSFFRGKKTTIRLRFRNMRLRKDIVKKILSIGLAPFTLQLGSSLVILVLNKQLFAISGDMGVAALGAIFPVTMFLVMPIIGLSQGAQPIIGYNYGAKKIDRLKKAFLISVTIASIHAIVMSIIVQLFPHFFIQMFSQDKALVAIGTHGIRIYLAMMPFVGFLILGANFFTAIGKAPQSMFLNLSRQVIFFVPLLLILPHYFGINGVWLAMPLSDITALVLTTILLIRQFKHLTPDKDDIIAAESVISPDITEPYCISEASEQAL